MVPHHNLTLTTAGPDGAVEYAAHAWYPGRWRAISGSDGVDTRSRRSPVLEAVCRRTVSEQAKRHQGRPPKTTMQKRQALCFLQVGVQTVILLIILITTACNREEPPASQAKIVRLDKAIDTIIPPTAQIEKLAGGFRKTEGPVWHHDGYLLFSELESGQIYTWTPNGQASALPLPNEHAGKDQSDQFFFGANGLALDRDGRLTILRPSKPARHAP